MKICMPCFAKRFGAAARPRIHTWGRQCAICKADTPSRGLLIRVEDPTKDVVRQPA
jgi:hypothetical protein